MPMVSKALDSWHHDQLAWSDVQSNLCLSRLGIAHLNELTIDHQVHAYTQSQPTMQAWGAENMESSPCDGKVPTLAASIHQCMKDAGSPQHLEQILQSCGVMRNLHVAYSPCLCKATPVVLLASEPSAQCQCTTDRQRHKNSHSKGQGHTGSSMPCFALFVSDFE
jgi:hypothetical protein